MKDESPSAWREVWAMLRAIVIAVIIALLVRQFVVETYQVDGISMEPTLQNGERLLVNKFIYRFETPHVGQIIVFHPPIPGITVDYVKRVIALPGQTFYSKDGQIFINGKLLAEPWEPASWLGDFTGSEFLKQPNDDCPYSGPVDPNPITIPTGYVFVLGDHRAVSYDSRCFGIVPMASIRGQVMLVWWPFADFRTL